MPSRSKSNEIPWRFEAGEIVEIGWEPEGGSADPNHKIGMTVLILRCYPRPPSDEYGDETYEPHMWLHDVLIQGAVQKEMYGKCFRRIE